MRILTLSAEQFRNHAHLSLELRDPDVQLFLGPNGSGKTNILEAVSVLAFTKSFLGVEDESLRTWGTEFYRVTARVRTDAGEERELQVVSQIAPRKQKGCFVNGVRVPLTGLIGALPTVIFLPQDLTLFTGSPSERRRYLDQILSQVSPEYFSALLEYQKIIKQRNALLKAIREGTAPQDVLDAWDQQLAEKGSVLTLMRLELTETFTLTLRDEVKALGETWGSTEIRYQHSGTARDPEALRAEMESILRSQRERDIILQTTVSGPHRDDWSVLVDGRSIGSFASRGQQRVAVLALLFLEAAYLEVRGGEKPVILLDDIFSELDEAHRERVSKAFSGHQVLMTATDIPGGADEAFVWHVEAGVVQGASVVS